MRVLVTGAGGFIGSHLVKKLLQEGHELSVLDRFSKGKEDYLSELEREARVKVIKADLSKSGEIKEKYFSGIDWVFHFGAVSSVSESLQKPLFYHRVNVSGTFNVLFAALRQKVKKFIYAGSASVYGVSSEIPTTEKAAIILDSPYATSKFLGEELVMHFGRVYKLPVISVRMVSVYGPRPYKGGTFGSILTLFMRQKEAHVAFSVVGDGRQRRDLVYVGDACEAILKLAKSKIKNEIFNIGGGRTYSIIEIVKLLGGKITYLPKRPWEGSFKQVDITKIGRFTGWSPRVDLKEGIGRILG